MYYCHSDFGGLNFSAYNFKTCSTFETMACCTQKVVALATQCGEDDGYSVRTQVTSPSALKEKHCAPFGISLAHLNIHMKQQLTRDDAYLISL